MSGNFGGGFGVDGSDSLLSFVASTVDGGGVGVSLQPVTDNQRATSG